MSASRAIGFGCTTSTDIEDIIALIRTSLGDLDSNKTILATLDRHVLIGRAVADDLGLDLILFSSDALSQVTSVTHSSKLAQATVGTPSVAEAAAIAALGVQAQLTITRVTGRRCTCALAELV